MYSIGFDDNLGLPQNFAQEIPCQLVSYHDLVELIDAFSSGKLDSIFIPAGTLLHLKIPYQILAQATLGPEQKVNLCSHFCSLHETSLANISQKKLGRVNSFCTTSYWAPMIYMFKKQLVKSKLKFEDTESFEDMLNKTVSGQIAYSMIWEAVLKKYPESAKKLRTFFKYDDLPTPIIIGIKGISDVFIKQLQNFHSNDKKSFFSGFTRPNEAHIEKFKQEMLQAKTLT